MGNKIIVLMLTVTLMFSTVNASTVAVELSDDLVGAVEYLLFTVGGAVIGTVVYNNVETEFEDLNTAEKLFAVNKMANDYVFGGGLLKNITLNSGYIELTDEQVAELEDVLEQNTELTNSDNSVIRNYSYVGGSSDLTMSAFERSFYEWLNENIKFLNDGTIDYREEVYIGGQYFSTWKNYSLSEIYGVIPTEYVYLFENYLNDSVELLTTTVSGSATSDMPAMIYQGSILSNFILYHKFDTSMNSHFYMLIESNSDFYIKNGHVYCYGSSYFQMLVSGYDFKESFRVHIGSNSPILGYPLGTVSTYVDEQIYSNKDVFDTSGMLCISSKKENIFVYYPTSVGVNVNEGGLADEDEDALPYGTDIPIEIPTPSDVGISEEDVNGAIGDVGVLTNDDVIKEILKKITTLPQDIAMRLNPPEVTPNPEGDLGPNLFNIINLLIVILIAILLLLLKYFALVVAIFNIDANTELLNDDVVAGLNFFKNIELPLFNNMTVFGLLEWAFVFLLLISVGGFLKKAIDRQQMA